MCYSAHILCFHSACIRKHAHRAQASILMKHSSVCMYAIPFPGNVRNINAASLDHEKQERERAHSVTLVLVLCVHEPGPAE